MWSNKFLEKVGLPSLSARTSEMYFGSDLGQPGTASNQSAFIGADGTAGSMGFTGATGATGAAAALGMTGPQGPRGALRVMVATGAGGATGVTGPADSNSLAV
jgi:hypothetical protein